jgi:Na+-transporting methylmalonyl-CoA/oxaloacetate decarboxylase gamma subunit
MISSEQSVLLYTGITIVFFSILILCAGILGMKSFDKKFSEKEDSNLV